MHIFTLVSKSFQSLIVLAKKGFWKLDVLVLVIGSFVSIADTGAGHHVNNVMQINIGFFLDCYIKDSEPLLMPVTHLLLTGARKHPEFMTEEIHLLGLLIYI